MSKVRRKRSVYHAIAQFVAISTAVVYLALKTASFISWASTPYETLARIGGLDVVKCLGQAVWSINRIHAESPDTSEVALSLGDVMGELRRYPSSLLDRARLRRVVLCSRLTTCGEEMFGAADFETSSFYIDISKAFDIVDEDTRRHYLRMVVHHELFHMLDVANGLIEQQKLAWLALNPQGFCYEDGSAKMHPHAMGRIDSEPPLGFINMYSTTNILEDRASIFECLMVERQLLAERTARDALLEGKVRQIKLYLETLCPEIGKSFWEGG